MALVNDLKINDIISFSSLNITDPNLYLGKIEGFITYDIAKQYTDLKSYHDAVLSITSASIIPTNYTQLSYFLLKIPNKSELLCFAKEWINEQTLEIMKKLGKVTIDIMDVIEDDVDTIIGILNSAGYHTTFKNFNSDINY